MYGRYHIGFWCTRYENHLISTDLDIVDVADMILQIISDTATGTGTDTES